MEQTANKPNKLNIIDAISKTLYPFFFGKAFPAFIGLIVALFYVCKLPLIALAIISILATVIFLFFKDVSPIIPLLFMVVLAFRDYDDMGEIWPYVILMPAIASFVARFFIHPIKWRMPGKLFFPLIFVSLAFALAGVLTPIYDFMFGIAYFVSLGPTMIIIYLFFYYNLYPQKNFSVKHYLCNTLIVSGLVMIFQMAFVRYVELAPEHWELGWANINAGAAFLLLSIPACYYLIVKAKSVLPLIIVLLMLYAGVMLSGSDATFGIVLIYSPFLILYTYRHIYRTNRIIFSYSIGLIVIIIASSVIVLTSIFGIEKALALLNIEFTDSGRNHVYQEAVRLFRENPIFGYGFQYNVDGRENSSIGLYNFHSTLLHVMATMGTFGLLSYAFYFVMRFIILMKKFSPFTVMMLVAFIMYESYAMVDTGEFNAIPLMSAVTVLITVVEFATKKGNATTALPLSTNKRHGYNF